MSHPYASLPDHCFWRRSISPVPMAEVDPVVRPRFRIRKTDRVSTAGSCFAQHIARHLASAGFNYFVTETANPFISDQQARDYNYVVFTARYGNVYTARQLTQMLKRAYGLFQPVDDIWVTADGRFFDPYRPQIQPGGFSSEREFRADREQHFAAIRRAVEQSDVLVFTLGLTEAWINARDGSAYPVCPGTAAGTFDPAEHKFVNFRMTQVLGDMREAFDFVRDRNPRIRFVVTVSPVPLVATAEDRHVLVSTTYSKSVLRTVCGELEAQFEDVAYFPSYEIITGNFNRGAYFQPDLREVTEAGVRHVMRLFMHHYAVADDASAAVSEPRMPAETQSAGDVAAVVAAAAKVVCDEEVLERR
jgi:hypothetical protein